MSADKDPKTCCASSWHYISLHLVFLFTSSLYFLTLEYKLRKIEDIIVDHAQSTKEAPPVRTSAVTWDTQPRVGKVEALVCNGPKEDALSITNTLIDAGNLTFHPFGFEKITLRVYDLGVTVSPRQLCDMVIGAAPLYGIKVDHYPPVLQFTAP